MTGKSADCLALWKKRSQNDWRYDRLKSCLYTFQGEWSDTAKVTWSTGNWTWFLIPFTGRLNVTPSREKWEPVAKKDVSEDRGEGMKKERKKRKEKNK